MHRIVNRLPSPAMVVACLALAVALGGTSYAAIRLPANSVGTKQLKRGAVTGVKVKSNTLTGTQINEARLGRVPSAANSTTADVATTASVADRAAVARLDYSASNTFPVNAGQFGHLSANCPAGLNAVGGGVKFVDPFNSYVADSNPVGKTGWEATGYSDITQNMTVYVICAQAAATTP